MHTHCQAVSVHTQEAPLRSLPLFTLAYDKVMLRFVFNLLKPNDIYICRTAALTSGRYILDIYSTNIHTEYFKHAA